MIQLLNSLMTLSHPEQLANLDMDLESINTHIYWKDRAGIFLGSNDFQPFEGKYMKGSELLGLTDFDLHWSDYAPMLQRNDQEIISGEKPRVQIEPAALPDGSETNVFSYKMPLRTKAKKVIGVFGISLWPQQAENCSAEKIHLTKCQTDCLYYLVKGMTMKQIAATIGRSPKAVEHHLEAVKIKLNCDTRSELISKALQLPVIINRVLFDTHCA